jgi:predicted Zn-dependent protease
LLKRGRFSEAEAPLRTAVRLRPSYGYALYNLGWCLLEQSRAREAIEPLRESAALQPGRWEPQQKLSEAYVQLGNHDLAFEARARARELRGATRGRRAQVRPKGPATQVAVRMMVGDSAWVGSTDRREARYLQERQEWRLQEAMGGGKTTGEQDSEKP